MHVCLSKEYVSTRHDRCASAYCTCISSNRVLYSRNATDVCGHCDILQYPLISGLQHTKQNPWTHTHIAFIGYWRVVMSAKLATSSLSSVCVSWQKISDWFNSGASMSIISLLFPASSKLNRSSLSASMTTGPIPPLPSSWASAVSSLHSVSTGNIPP